MDESVASQIVIEGETSFLFNAFMGLVGLMQSMLWYGMLMFVFMLIYLYFYQESMLYVNNMPDAKTKFPENLPPGFRSPAERNLPFEDLRLKTKDGLTLAGWFVKQQEPKNADTLLFFHANAGNIGGRLPLIEILYHHCGFNVVIVGYRGYGHSEGSPTEAGLELDAEAMFKFCQDCSEIDNNKIFVLGRSLGGAVAIQTAEKYQTKIKGIILENTFSSIDDLVDVIFPFLKLVKPYVLRMHWPSIERITRVEIPILFIIGQKDELVPATQGQRLYEAATKCRFKDRLLVPNGTHNETWHIAGQSYVDSINAFKFKAYKDMAGVKLGGEDISKEESLKNFTEKKND